MWNFLWCPTGIFKIEDSAHVARLWGLRKNRPAMNYDKLSRSIRQYYKKGIIRKPDVSQRLVYQFVHPVWGCGRVGGVRGETYKTKMTDYLTMHLNTKARDEKVSKNTCTDQPQWHTLLMLTLKGQLLREGLSVPGLRRRDKTMWLLRLFSAAKWNSRFKN